jgi:hypothetical protein
MLMVRPNRQHGWSGILDPGSLGERPKGHGQLIQVVTGIQFAVPGRLLALHIVEHEDNEIPLTDR